MLRTIKKIIGLERTDISACLASGFLLSLPFDSGRLWIFAWFGFVPVFLALVNKSLRQAFVLFFITGIIFWWLTIYWLVHVTFIGTAILVIYLALYFGVFGLVARPLTKRSTPMVLLSIPSAWVLLEYARSHLLTGFPWALLGYSQYAFLPVIQVADCAGALGVSFLVMQVNAGAVEIIWSAKERLRRRLWTTVAVLLLFLLPSLYYGSLRLTQKQETPGRAIKVAVIQGDIPQELKWDPRARAPIIAKYLSLSRDALEGRPELIVWPEASFPDLVGDDPRPLTKIAQFCASNKLPLLFGAVTHCKGAYYNSAIFLSDKGDETGRYDKIHLVPFGEYIPLKKFLPFLEVVVPIGDINRGSEYTVFSLPSGGRFSVLICFEDLFPELSRRFINRGADFLVTITNDAWYKKTSAAQQHLQASVFRAVENRRFMARAANTGISAFILPTGRILSAVKDKSGQELFVDGYLVADAAIAKRSTSFYTRHGDFFIFGCAFLFLAGLFCRGKRLRGKPDV